MDGWEELKREEEPELELMRDETDAFLLDPTTTLVFAVVFFFSALPTLG